MNVLGMTSALLIIFAITTHTLMKSRITSEKIQMSYQGYMNAACNAQNKFEKKCYAKARGKPKRKNQPRNRTATQQPKRKKREEEIPECAKLNLWPLFDEKKDEKTYEILAALLTLLYGNKSFFQYKIHNLEKHLIDQILLSAKENNSHYLPKLQLKDVSLQLIYYKVLKGSKIYDFEQRYGYPSLLDFVKIQPTNDLICINCAPQEILSVLFGEKVAMRIKEEREKNEEWALNKESLEELCLKENFSPIDSSLLERVSFCHKRRKKASSLTVSGIDKNTQISIKKTIYLE